MKNEGHSTGGEQPVNEVRSVKIYGAQLSTAWTSNLI